MVTKHLDSKPSKPPGKLREVAVDCYLKGQFMKLNRASMQVTSHQYFCPPVHITYPNGKSGS